jgi:hypothetical protein
MIEEVEECLHQLVEFIPKDPTVYVVVLFLPPLLLLLRAFQLLRLLCIALRIIQTLIHLPL